MLNAMLYNAIQTNAILQLVAVAFVVMFANRFVTAINDCFGM